MRPTILQAIVALAALSGPLSAQQNPVTTVITDQAGLPTRGKFGLVNYYVMGENGDVFFTSGSNSALFQWTAGAGKKRLLQTNDPIASLGLSPETTAQIPSGGLVDTLSQLQTFGDGRLALVATAAIKGERDPVGMVYWDGSAFRVNESRVKTVSQFFVNASGRLALAGASDPVNLGPSQIFMEKASGETVKIAEQGQPAPGVSGTYGAFTLIGHSNNGQVAFLANINGGPAPLALYITDGGTPKLLVKSGDSASGAGTFTLRGQAANYFMNNDGLVAFAADANGGPSGIWVASAGAAPKKVFRANEPTGVDLGGTIGNNFTLRDFNDAGNVLYSSNVPGTTSGQALFIRNSDSGDTKLVFSRGMPAWPGTQFETTQQALMNASGKVAFLASVSGQQPGLAWFLGAGGEAPVRIAADGDPAPGGGKFAFAGRNNGPLINANGQVTFLADVRETNATGMFWWAPGGDVQAVMTTNDDLPEGANPVLRAGPPISSDSETLVRAYQAGGSITYYAVSLAGDGASRRIAGDFDALNDTAVMVAPTNFSLNSNGEAVFFASILGPGPYPRQTLFGKTAASGLVTIASSGDDAPGGGRFTSFSTTQITNKTEVIFFANLDSGNGIFFASADPPALRKIVRTGDAWPGGPNGLTIANFNNSLSANDKGQVAFLASSSNPPRQGLFIGTASDPPQKIAETTAPAPQGTFNGLMAPLKLTANGDLLFVGNYGGPSGGGSGVFLGKASGAPQTLANSGARAPGTTDSNYQFFNPNSVIANNNGTAAFWAAMCCKVFNGWFTASADGGTQAKLLSGMPPPDGGVIATLSPDLRFAALSDAGELAVFAPDVQDAPIKQQILVAGADGKLRRLAGSGEPAADTQSEYGKLIGNLVATPGGRFVFSAILVNGPAKAGVFVSNPQ